MMALQERADVSTVLLLKVEAADFARQASGSLQHVCLLAPSKPLVSLAGTMRSEQQTPFRYSELLLVLITELGQGMLEGGMAPDCLGDEL
jgi:hypothetical protein